MLKVKINMTEQNPSMQPPAGEQLPDNIMRFDQVAFEAIDDFGLLHSNGVNGKEGVITADSLAATHVGLIDKAKEDPELARLLGHVASPREEEELVAVKSRIIAFLKLNGGAVATSPESQATPAEAKSNIAPARQRKFGHTILVDGRTTSGFINGRPNEVVTSQGVLHTRGTPRLGNS